MVFIVFVKIVVTKKVSHKDKTLYFNCGNSTRSYVKEGFLWQKKINNTTAKNVIEQWAQISFILQII